MIVIEFYENADKLSDAAAADFLAAGTAAISERGVFKAAISGGNGPKGMFSELAGRPGSLDWARVELYWVDERWVSWESPESNFGEAQRLWLDGMKVKPSLFPMWNAGTNPHKGAQNYGAMLEKRLGRAGFDWCQLGMGPDGHTASLFPGQDSLKERSRCCLAVKHPESHQDRVTLSLPWINACQSVLFLVSGTGKTGALDAVIKGGTSLPAALVQPSSGHLRWLVERH